MPYTTTYTLLSRMDGFCLSAHANTTATLARPVGNIGRVLCKAPFTRYNLSSNRLSNRIDNRLYRVYKHSKGCQTRLTTVLTTGCIVYTAGCQQPVV